MCVRYSSLNTIRQEYRLPFSTIFMSLTIVFIRWASSVFPLYCGCRLRLGKKMFPRKNTSKYLACTYIRNRFRYLFIFLMRRRRNHSGNRKYHNLQKRIKTFISLLFIWACHFSFLNFFKLRASREKKSFAPTRRQVITSARYATTLKKRKGKKKEGLLIFGAVRFTVLLG